MSGKKPDLEELIKQFKEGKKLALSRLITLVENDPILAKEIFKHFNNLLEKAYVVGITGPPGAGKSTLVDIMAKKIVEKGKSVGIISVDPTSPFSGGAFLGDRIRMKHSVASDPNVFMRSIASRGVSGGLSRAIFDITLLFEAYGKDIIIIETVGAGQSEVDIFEMAYTTIVVSVPGLGDQIQVQKAGIIEIADILVVNKKDLGGEDVAVALDLMLDDVFSYGMGQGWRPPVVMTNGITGEGVDLLIEEIFNHKRHIELTDILEKKKRHKIKKKIHDIILTTIEDYINKNIINEEKLEEVLKRIEKKEVGMFEAAYDIFDEYLEKLK
ncbi:MAG: methylmalonyl Co-A mutase-associated GTPase MeaB [Candidatus Helarchaeota archaeon]